jgi:hypothetical protein
MRDSQTPEANGIVASSLGLSSAQIVEVVLTTNHKGRYRVSDRVQIPCDDRTYYIHLANPLIRKKGPLQVIVKACHESSFICVPGRPSLPANAVPKMTRQRMAIGSSIATGFI